MRPPRRRALSKKSGGRSKGSWHWSGTADPINNPRVARRFAFSAVLGKAGFGHNVEVLPMG